jgi:hypothetical protein
VAPYQEEGMFMRVCVRKIYLLNIPISGLIGAITKALLERVGPEWFAYGVWVSLTGCDPLSIERSICVCGGKTAQIRQVFSGSCSRSWGCCCPFLPVSRLSGGTKEGAAFEILPITCLLSVKPGWKAKQPQPAS